MGEPQRIEIRSEPADGRTTMTRVEWRTEGTRRFGADTRGWRFVCPSCGHVATPLDWINAGAPATAIAFSCVGRWQGANGEFLGRKGQRCNYAGGGLFALNPVRVTGDDGETNDVFAFADAARAGEDAAS